MTEETMRDDAQAQELTELLRWHEAVAGDYWPDVDTREMSRRTAAMLRAVAAMLATAGGRTKAGDLDALDLDDASAAYELAAWLLELVEPMRGKRAQLVDGLMGFMADLEDHLNAVEGLVDERDVLEVVA